MAPGTDRMKPPLVIAAGLLLVPFADRLLAARIPVELRVGVQTVIVPLAAIPADKRPSELELRNPVVGFAFDAYVFVLPWYHRNGRYVVCEGFEDYSDQPGEFWVLSEQFAGALAAKFGISEAELATPMSYYFPLGWFTMLSLVALVWILSGRQTPASRFAKLWSQDHYRSALYQVLFGNTDDLSASLPILLDAVPNLDDQIESGVSLLVTHGESKRRARRELDFLLRYMIDNHLLMVVDLCPGPDPQTTANQAPADPNPTDPGPFSQDNPFVD